MILSISVKLGRELTLRRCSLTPDTRSVYITLNAIGDSSSSEDRFSRNVCIKALKESSVLIYRNSHGRGIPSGTRRLNVTTYSERDCKNDKKTDTLIHIFNVRNPFGYIPVPTPPTRGRLQPRVVTFEAFPARKVAGVVNLPEGSPWCPNNDATIWLTGHKRGNDSPSCRSNEGDWVSSDIVLDDGDILNNEVEMDRHDCGALDVNGDGVLDLHCQVGAIAGRGQGFDELYITQPNGKLVKVYGHGFHTYTGTRGRFVEVLNGRNGDKFVFSATKNGPRTDGRSNAHRMYRNVTGPACTKPVVEGEINNSPCPYVEEVEGPFNVETHAFGLHKADINGDGLDDLIVCHKQGYGGIYIQTEDASWKDPVEWESDTTKKRAENWRKVRVGDFDGDGILDLAVAYELQYVLSIYPGISKAPYFDLSTSMFTVNLDHAAPDIEVIDMNGDGILDLYVVQNDEVAVKEVTKYCSGKFFAGDWWWPGNQPPPAFVPPFDLAPDKLFVGKGRSGVTRDNTKQISFEEVTMTHAEPGCGNLVRPFGEKKLILAQGNFVRPGHNLLLDWS